MKNNRCIIFLFTCIVSLLLSGCQQSETYSQQGLPLGKTLETYSQLFGSGYNTVVEKLDLGEMQEYKKGTGIWVSKNDVIICDQLFQQSFSIDPKTDSLWSISYVCEMEDTDTFADLVQNVMKEAEAVYGVPSNEGYTPKLSNEAIARIRKGEFGSWFEGWALKNDVGLTVAVSVQNGNNSKCNLGLEFFPNKLVA